MTQIMARIAITLSVLLSIFLFTGCASSPEPRLYMLEAAPESELAEVRSTDISVLVDVVTLPDHLRRSEIISRVAPHRVTVASFDRWAEPLDRNIANIVVAHLSSRFGPENVFDRYARFTTEPVILVRLRIFEFAETHEEQVTLRASWELSDPRTDTSRIFSREFHQPSSSDSTDATVEAMSVALAGLSHAIGISISEWHSQDS